MQIFKTKRSFKKEFKRQIKLALIAAVGFTIAFAWREAILSLFTNIAVRILDVDPDHYLTNIYAALFLTLAGVIFILITSRIFRE